MSSPIKSAVEITVNIITNRFKCLPSEIKVRVKEHSCPVINRSFVHIVFKINKFIKTYYSQFSTNDVIKPQTKCKNEKRQLEKCKGSL